VYLPDQRTERFASSFRGSIYHKPRRPPRRGLMRVDHERRSCSRLWPLQCRL